MRELAARGVRRMQYLRCGKDGIQAMEVVGITGESARGAERGECGAHAKRVYHCRR